MYGTCTEEERKEAEEGEKVEKESVKYKQKNLNQGVRKNVENPCVLLCFRSQVVTRIGFIVFSLQHIEKALVLSCFRLQVLIIDSFYFVFAPKTL